MQRLNYNQLYYFYTVALEGSIKAASEKLHLTQPTISEQVRQLEDELGHTLFERKHRRLELNEQGRIVLKKAQKIFTLGEELIVGLNRPEAANRLETRVGVVPSLPSSFVHKFALRSLSDKDRSIHIVHAPLTDLIHHMDEGDLDLILSDTPWLNSMRQYKCINLGTQELWVVGTESFKPYRKNFPNSLSGLPYLAFAKNGQIRDDVDYFFRINNIHPDLVGSVDDTTLIRTVTEKGLCFSVLPEKSVRDSVKKGNLIKIGELSQVTSNRWAIMSNSSSHKIYVRRLINSFLLSKKKKPSRRRTSRGKKALSQP